jgi:flagellar biosynthesis chaperone FliJ
MPDPETKEAINEVLCSINERLRKEWQRERRKREGYDAWSAVHQIQSERMETYARAMKIVDEHLHRLFLKEESDR